MKTLEAAIGAWVSGLAVFWACGKALTDAPIRLEGFLTVATVSAICLVFLIPLGYLPVARAVLSLVSLARARAVSATLSAALGVVPLAVVAMVFQDGERAGLGALLRGGTVLWFALFLVTGVAFALLDSRPRKGQAA